MLKMTKPNIPCGYIWPLTVEHKGRVMANQQLPQCEKIARTCKLDGCEKPTRHGGSKASYCMMHYHRLYRYGTLERSKCKSEPILHKTMGRMLKWVGSDHPLVKLTGKKNGLVYYARFVAYNHYGDGEHPCHWCGRILGWKELSVDHFDENPLNDDITNLRLSCISCNSSRSNPKAVSKLIEKIGVFYELDGERLCVEAWSRKIGISSTSLLWRLKNGWTLRDALTKPRGRTGTKTTKWKNKYPNAKRVWLQKGARVNN